MFFLIGLQSVSSVKLRKHEIVHQNIFCDKSSDPTILYGHRRNLQRTVPQDFLGKSPKSYFNKQSGCYFVSKQQHVLIACV